MQSLYQKLFDFIMESFIGQSLKRVTIGNPGPLDHESSELLITIEGSSSTDEEKYKQKYKFESEMMIEFNHGDRVEKWTHFDHAKKDIVKGNNQAMHGKVRTKKKEKEKEVEIPKGKLFSSESEREEDHKMTPRRFFINNINEKSEAFIRQKREALRKSVSSDKF